MQFIMSVDLYTGTTRPGRNPHSCCTLIETVVVSVTCTNVLVVGPPVGKLTLWLIICGQHLTSR